MSEKVQIIKKVYKKNNYTEVVDTTFNQLISLIKPNEEEEISVDGFFELYNDVFFKIPKKGDDNSHQYIIEKSSQYLGDEFTNPLIDELQREITSLKQQQLVSSDTISDLTTQLTTLGDSFKTFNT